MISHHLSFTQSHCDFAPLRHLLLATHMQDLKEVTHVSHYENFRRKKLGVMVEQEVGIMSIIVIIIWLIM
jgi:septin family protein